LDRKGDCAGVAAAYVLDNELAKADERYRQCKPGDAEADANLKADRAGIAVLRQQFEAALDLTQQVIDVVPNHAVAWWNRALAERELGLDLSAAASFERAAAIDRATERRWAIDATQRAEAMGGEAARLRRAYK